MLIVPDYKIPYTGAIMDVDLGAKNLTTTGLGTFGNLDVDTLNLNGNAITDSTGTISFDNEDLETTGIVSAASVSATTVGTTQDIFVDSDTYGLVLGDGQDVRIYSNGTNLYLGGLPTIIGNLTLASGSITDSSGAISFGNEVEAGGATTKIKLTSIGGYAIKLTNKTGGVTVAGQLVEADTATSDAVVLAGIADTDCFGVFLDSGIADSAEAWVVVSGIADVAFDDNVAAVQGNWVATGVAAGYARTSASPAAAPAHFDEIGHCIESVSAGGAGTHITARCVLHFN